ncbi:MFS transporter [Duganella fentianensis]|uniref:MFS transporter n=1 Tax=Duganella fentianensis TaxID=2692177 RepID=UPI0032B1D2A9
MAPVSDAAARLATRVLFLVAGFGYSCWAPLIPLTKARLGLDEHLLGLLLLCIGVGSILAMALTGALAVRYGTRPLLIVSGFGFAGALAALPLAPSVLALGINLLAFGATLGALDVAMNMHAVEVEKRAGVALMSGFHALFSVGGFAGSAVMTLLLSQQLATLSASLLCGAVMVLAMLLATPRILRDGGGVGGTMFALPRGVVLGIALLTCITFLVEGALLDWGALLLTQQGLFALEQAGSGYIVFSIAMTIARFSGDFVATRLGDQRTLLVGGVIALAGFAVLLTAVTAPLALTGFGLIGLGCANIVPVLFRRGANQQVMPAGLAIAAISTTAYAGILVGPACIGFIAQQVGLTHAFWLLAALLACVPASALWLVRGRPAAA